MARKASGQVIPPKGSRRSWAIRFHAYGKRRQITLGRSDEGWNRQRVEAELRHVLADVERGTWQPHEPEPVEAPEREPTFHEFADAWFEAGKPEWREHTINDYRWALELHLLPWFGKLPLSQITAEEIDRYKVAKLKEKKIAANSINKTITRLAQILEVAVEYGRIDRNPAKGKRRRVKATEPKRTWVEVEQLPYLIDAADERVRPLIATLAGAGLRIGEATSLTWRDVNLSTATLTVRESKTAAGEGREIDMPIGLREELTTWRAKSPRTGRSDPVFLSRERSGLHAAQTPRNFQARLKKTVERANEKLSEDGIEPMGNITPHSLRRTYASLRAALRDDPVYIAEMLGHRDPGFTFRTYQRAAKRREKLSGMHLEAFDRAAQWAQIGTGRARQKAQKGTEADSGPEAATKRQPSAERETAV